MARRQKQKPWADERYEVTVWDFEGNIVEKLWDASYEEAEQVREKFADEPHRTVVIDER